METYEIKGSDGKTYTIQGPAGASQDFLQNFIESQIKADKAKESAAKFKEEISRKASVTPEEFSLMTSAIREIEEALGTSSPRVLTQGEMINRESLAKSIVAINTIEKDSIITRDLFLIIGAILSIAEFSIDRFGL